jgi:uncharacterized membrane protein
MKEIPEKDYYFLFRAGIWLKGIDGALEALAGLVLAFTSYEAIRNIFTFVAGTELAETPHDWFLTQVLHGAHGALAYSKSFWATLFIVHGATKVFLAIELWREQLWAYPAAVAIFSLFVIYQVYHMVYMPSILLDIITLLDIAFIFLTVHEYRRQT